MTRSLATFPWPLALALALSTSACGADSAPATPAAVSAGAAAESGESVSRIGDVTVRASVMQTSRLDAAVAAQYGIRRDDRRVLLLVGVRRGAEAQETALPAKISATATDLRGRKQKIVMRELRSGELLDYIGTVEIGLPDTVRFDVDIVREDGATSSMQLTREFYPR